jgi:hypothetical protein
MINLLKYYAKKRLNIVLLISIILITCGIVLFREGFIYETVQTKLSHCMNSPIKAIGVFAIILCYIVPLFEFSFKMRKVGIDEFYKLPITRRKLYLTKYIVGILEVIIPITIFFIFMLVWMLLAGHMFILKYYFIYYFKLLIIIFCLFSIVSFIYSKCNTIYDGVILVLLFIFVPFFIGEMFVNIYYEITGLRNAISTFHSESLINTVFISDISGFYYTKMSNYKYADTDNNTLFSVYFFIVEGIVSFTLLILLSKKEKAENSMDISSSWFSYKVVLPIYIMFFTSFFIFNLISVFWIILVAYFVYVLYRRTFKIKWYDIICITNAVITGLLIGIL